MDLRKDGSLEMTGSNLIKIYDLLRDWVSMNRQVVFWYEGGRPGGTNPQLYVSMNGREYGASGELKVRFTPCHSMEEIEARRERNETDC